MLLLLKFSASVPPLGAVVLSIGVAKPARVLVPSNLTRLLTVVHPVMLVEPTALALKSALANGAG